MSLAASLKLRARRPLRFALTGIANTLVGLAVIYAAKYFLGLSDIAANAFGYSVGLMLGFGLNATWTFSYTGARSPAFVKYLLAFAVSYGANLATVMALIQHADTNTYLAQAAGVPLYTASFYLLSRYFVFPEKGCK